MNKIDASFSFYLHIKSEVWKTASSLKAPHVQMRPPPIPNISFPVQNDCTTWSCICIDVWCFQKSWRVVWYNGTARSTWEVPDMTCNMHTKTKCRIRDNYVCTKIRILLFAVEWDAADSEINVPSADEPELSKVTSLKPGVGQN